MKNKTLKVLISVILVQILAFIAMAGYSVKAYDDIMNSTEYKMAIRPEYLYDDKISFTTRTNPHYRTVGVYNGYVTIAFDENGYAFFNEYVEEKPDDDLYVKTNTKNNKRFNEYKIEIADEYRDLSFSMYDIEYEEAYIIFKINKGEAIVTAVYIDDIPIEEWIKNPVFEQISDDVLLGD